MTLAQTLAHCTSGMQMATGVINPKRASFPANVIGPLIKPLVFGDDKPMRRNSPSSPELFSAHHTQCDFERERAQLITASELSNTADNLLRQFDITQQQYNVLRILRGAGTEGLCRNQISARMVAAARDMSRLLDCMEKSGWITRERAEDDRRQVSTFITDSGKKLLTIIEGPVHEQTHRLFEGVKSTDLKMLVDVLAQIRSRRAELS